MPLGKEASLAPGDIVLDGDPAPPTERGKHSPAFRPTFNVAKRSPISATAEILFAHLTEESLQARLPFR